MTQIAGALSVIWPTKQRRMQKSMLDPKTTFECPYDPDTREAEAYWCGRNAEIPPPQIIMEDSLSDA